MRQRARQIAHTDQNLQAMLLFLREVVTVFLWVNSPNAELCFVVFCVRAYTNEFFTQLSFVCSLQQWCTQLRRSSLDSLWREKRKVRVEWKYRRRKKWRLKLAHSKIQSSEGVEHSAKLLPPVQFSKHGNRLKHKYWM